MFRTSNFFNPIIFPKPGSRLVGRSTTVDLLLLCFFSLSCDPQATFFPAMSHTIRAQKRRSRLDANKWEQKRLQRQAQDQPDDQKSPQRLQTSLLTQEVLQAVQEQANGGQGSPADQSKLQLQLLANLRQTQQSVLEQLATELAAIDTEQQEQELQPEGQQRLFGQSWDEQVRKLIPAQQLQQQQQQQPEEESKTGTDMVARTTRFAIDTGTLSQLVWDEFMSDHYTVVEFLILGPRFTFWPLSQNRTSLADEPVAWIAACTRLKKLSILDCAEVGLVHPLQLTGIVAGPAGKQLQELSLGGIPSVHMTNFAHMGRELKHLTVLRLFYLQEPAASDSQSLESKQERLRRAVQTQSISFEAEQREQDLVDLIKARQGQLKALELVHYPLPLGRATIEALGKHQADSLQVCKLVHIPHNIYAADLEHLFACKRLQVFVSTPRVHIDDEHKDVVQRMFLACPELVHLHLNGKAMELESTLLQLSTADMKDVAKRLQPAKIVHPTSDNYKQPTSQRGDNPRVLDLDDIEQRVLADYPAWSTTTLMGQSRLTS
jgi:hypothetical protein